MGAKGSTNFCATEKKGFTLVELLVVIAIIGVLVAILLPAIQAAREAARRTQCVNNVKQLALVLQNHHDTKKTFPASATWPSGKVIVSDMQTNMGANWLVHVLPYMEQSNVLDLYDKKRAMQHPNNQRFRSTRIDVLLCPSDAYNQVA